MPVTRAILFDLDGTLVDSIDDIAVALDAALADHALPAPARAQVREWVGGGARNLVAHAVAPALVEPVLARFRVHYTASLVVHTKVYDGLPPVLDALAARARLAVLSNKPHAQTVEICARLLSRWPFAAIAGHREGVPLKPDPTAALAIARDLGVAPAECTFVGDTAIDVATGRAAGMRAVAVAWGFRPRTELEAAAPDAIADTPDALLEI